MTKKIAIIGAGSSGLTAIKCCKEEGLDVVCFEKTENVGGLWRYHDDDQDGLPSVMKFTVINTSKELSAFSDFPPPKEFPNFMPHSVMLKYFEMYAEKFCLYKHIQYNTEVISISQADDYETTGRWNIKTKNTKTGEMITETYDGVMVCTGHHTYPRIPHFEGQGKFGGKIMHTHSLKTVSKFADQRVVVIGIGNSGLDSATEISSVARHVYLSTRRGSWVVGKTTEKGVPADSVFNNRCLSFIMHLIGWKLFSICVETVLNDRYNHELYGLKPKHRLLSQHTAMNDYLQSRLVNGLVTMKKDVVRLTENGVLFRGDKTVTEVDVIILATGYNVSFPFLPENVQNPVENKVQLYKLCFPPQLKHPSLVFIGLTQAYGCVFPIAENQSRWYACLMSGICSLPSAVTMRKDILKTEKEISRRYVDSPRHTLQVDYVPYMDDIAKQYGVKPNLIELFLSDLELFLACLIYPCLPYQYRLRGPHQWSGARKAILSYPQRVSYPLSGHEDKIDKSLFFPPIMSLKIWIPLLTLGFSLLIVIITFTLNGIL